MPCAAPLRQTASVLALSLLAPEALPQAGFVNFETPHVHPLELTPDGTRLLAVNTADGVLEVFDSGGAQLVPLAAIPVGVDPVSVRARTATEAWVVDHVSDGVAIVDLATGRVRASLETDDEPCDVVFAGSPERAFVSCSQANTVLVFDPENLGAAPVRIELDAEDPRAMAVSADGSEVYVAIFESGNSSTLLGGGSTLSAPKPPDVVSDNSGPYGGQNPPPNSGSSFSPPIDAGLPTPPEVSLIVKKDDLGRWMDDNGGDWTDFVSGPQAAKSGRVPGWDLLDHDVAVIDAASLSVSYVERLMNTDMALAVHPATGRLSVVGTEATNEIRFEPNLNGVFVRAVVALVEPDGSSPSVVDLNPHLDYSTSTVSQSLRDQSLGDPRGIAWTADGSLAFVSGMGSNNLVVVDASGARAGLAPTIEVGEGPTGVALHEAQGRLYVLNKFEASVSVVDLLTELEVDRLPFHDASPPVIRAGRKHLYDTHATSGLGQVSCAACHLDARMDKLAWDLGDPGGEMKTLDGQNLAGNVPLLTGGFEDWHPMKGPMLTQTLQDIIGKEPLHWRGDRAGIEEFNPAFIGLLGDDELLTGPEMQEFEDFLATIHFPPNPFRELDNTLTTDLPLPGHKTTGLFGPAELPLPNGDAQRGLALAMPPNFLDQGALNCSLCHTHNVGVGPDMTFNLFGGWTPFPVGPMGEHHTALVQVDEATNVTLKVPQLRNLYERTGFDLDGTSRQGFGYRHDGAVDQIETFVTEPLFTPASTQEVADLVAFMLSFSGSDLPQGTPGDLFQPPGPPSRDAHAAVGVRTTLESLAGASVGQTDLLAQLGVLADQNRIGLVAKARVGGEARGWVYQGGGSWQSDRAVETTTTAALEALAAPGSEVTFLAVPEGTEQRIGVDRDADGHFDRDELDQLADPANEASVPAGGCGSAVPNAPLGVGAIASGPGWVQIGWTDASTDESWFDVERSPAGQGAWDQVARVPADTTHFTDIGLACGDVFDYRVIATNCAGASISGAATGAGPACVLLEGTPATISIAAGGVQTFALEAGVQHAGRLHLLLGSASGTSPGIPVNGLVLPLNPGPYFDYSLVAQNGPLLVGTFGVLDGGGSATAQFVLPGAWASASLAGLVLHHAYVVLEPTTVAVVLTSNAVSLELVP